MLFQYIYYLRSYSTSKTLFHLKNELNIMVEDIDPHIIGIAESWANTDTTDAELGLTGYIMFRRDRIERRGGGVTFHAINNASQM